ncbi:MAG: nitroreductase family protein [Bdellovibrionales bacterium]|nr:nitroreductase family protein [Bdellovibrionales bacterium]
MDFFEAIRSRRSVRKYTAKPVPREVVQRALDAALLAPNSSNMQTWQFYWVRNAAKKQKLVEACFGQSAAATAQELVAIVAAPRVWRRNQQEMLRHLRETKAAKRMFQYYGQLIPFLYGYQWLAPVKWLLFNVLGLFKPMARTPWSRRDRQEVAVKSAALAAENFMLAIAAQGFASCPMEGFDESRVKKILDLRCGDRVVMICSVGEADPAGIWGPQLRFDKSWFVHELV